MRKPLYKMPITIKAAMRFVGDHHRHLRKVTGGLFAVAAADAEGNIVGVAIVGRPARKSQDGWTCTVTRLSTDGTPNACSFLYAMARRVAQAMGYRKVLTFTRHDEPGTSLFAMQLEPSGETRGGTWDRKSRRRNSVNTGTKKRWELLG